jgi:hypothetical protein
MVEKPFNDGTALQFFSAVPRREIICQARFDQERLTYLVNLGKAKRHDVSFE